MHQSRCWPWRQVSPVAWSRRDTTTPTRSPITPATVMPMDLCMDRPTVRWTSGVVGVVRAVTTMDVAGTGTAAGGMVEVGTEAAAGMAAGVAPTAAAGAARGAAAAMGGMGIDAVATGRPALSGAAGLRPKREVSCVAVKSGFDRCRPPAPCLQLKLPVHAAFPSRP